MHGPSDALAAPVPPAQELSDDLVHVPSPAQISAVVAVGSHDGVLVIDAGLHADADGLLAVVQVAEPADELSLVQDVGGDFHPSHAKEVLEEAQYFSLRGLHLLVRHLVQLVPLERRGDLTTATS